MPKLGMAFSPVLWTEEMGGGPKTIIRECKMHTNCLKLKLYEIVMALLWFYHLHRIIGKAIVQFSRKVFVYSLREVTILL